MLPTNSIDGSSQVIKDFQLSRDSSAKLDYEYGKSIAKYIVGTLVGQASYFFLRNARFKLNRDWAAGRINVEAMFRDRLDMNGKTNYTNLSWKATLICNTIIAKKVGAWMRSNEKISVSAIDSGSEEQKKQQADYAEFLLEHKDKMEQLQQQSGVPLIPQDQFVPEDKDDLDSWVEEFNQLPEEIKSELGINSIFALNGFQDVIKEKHLWDSAVTGLVWMKVEMNEDGEIIPSWIKPENSFYSHSEYPDFRDTSYRGEATSFKISQVRKQFGKENGGRLSEQDIWEKIVPYCKEYQRSDKISWNEQWNLSYFRPYDEWNIDAIIFEIKSVDTDTYQMKVSKSGTLIVDENPSRIQSTGQKKSKDKWNIYRGIYAREADIMLEWGLKENMIRPQDPKEIGEAEFSYSGYMYQNNEMRNIAIPEKIEQPLEDIILTLLKIQQTVAVSRPPGSMINWDAIQEIPYGLGEDGDKAINPRKLYDQTGTLYYRSRDAEGNPIPVPITEIANAGFLPQMQGYIQLYQFQWQTLKDQLGDDPNIGQKALNPRVTSGNVQASMYQADNATDYMYYAVTCMYEDASRKIACLMQDSVRSGAKFYRHLMNEEDVKDRIFSTKMKVLPNDQEIQELQAMLNNAITANKDFIIYCDTFKIMRVAKENAKLAEGMFRKAQKRYIKAQMEIASKNTDENIKGQIESAKSAMEGELKMATQANQFKQEQILLQSIMDMYVNTTAAPKEGQAPAKFPSELQELAKAMIVNVAMPLVAKDASELQAVAMQMAQQQQQEQQAAAQQQMGQQQMGQQQMVA